MLSLVTGKPYEIWLAKGLPPHRPAGEEGLADLWKRLEDGAVQHCWARIEQAYPEWVASPQGQTWKEELTVWQQKGREQVERERAEWTTSPAGHAWQARLKSWQLLGRQQLQEQAKPTPSASPVDPVAEAERTNQPWVEQNQRSPSLAALEAQCNVWRAQARHLQSIIQLPLMSTGQRWGRRALGIASGVFVGLALDALVLTVFPHALTWAHAFPWVGLGVGFLLAEARIHAPEARQMDAMQQQGQVLRLLRDHEVAQPGQDIRPHDYELWQKYPASATLLAHIQEEGEGLMLVKDVERLNELLGATLYRNFIARK